MILRCPSPSALDDGVDVDFDLHPWHREAVNDNGRITGADLPQMPRNNSFDLWQKLPLSDINSNFTNILGLRARFVEQLVHVRHRLFRLRRDIALADEFTVKRQTG